MAATSTTLEASLIRERNDDMVDRLSQAAAMAGARPEDIQLEREIDGGESDSAPGIPAGNLDADEVEAARENARGALGQGPVGMPIQSDAGEDVGAPWDRVDDGARIMRDQLPDAQGN